MEAEASELPTSGEDWEVPGKAYETEEERGRRKGLTEDREGQRTWKWERWVRSKRRP